MPLHEVRLLAVVGPPTVRDEALVAACRAAAEGGVTGVQVRMKAASASVLRRATETVRAALSIPVYVNDRVDVALAARAHGVHLGAEDVSPDAARALAPHPFQIGVSVGSADEAEAVMRSKVDYWSIGSIYATDTKPDAGVPIGTSGFRSLAERAPSHMTVIAIGGITVANAEEILGAGAQGIAVSRAIFSSRDVARSARALRDIVDRALAG